MQERKKSGKSSIKKSFLMYLIVGIIIPCMILIFAKIHIKAEEKTISAFDGTKPIDPWDYQKLLGKGMDVDWCKTEQGMKYYQTEASEKMKSSGLGHVRIRIKSKATEELFQYLDKQIEDCLKNNLIPVIAYQAKEFKKNPTKEAIQKVTDWWSAVAERYQDKSYLLAFDLLIEASDAINKQPEALNELYESIVPEIRKTNPERIIIISPRLRSDAAYLSELKIPTGHNGYLMAEWHFYASGPSKVNARKLWTTGTEEEKKLITNKIELALKWQEETKIPTWVGAWMAGNYNEGNSYTIEEQIAFAAYMVEQLTNAKIPFAVNSDTKFYDRTTNLWIESMQPLFECIYGQKASGGTISGELSVVSSSGIKVNNKVYLGFNAKGNLDTNRQCRYVKKLFKSLRKKNVSTDKIYLRLQGGTISQKTFSKDWTDKSIEAWAKIQQEYQCNYIFVINFNDTVKNQYKFYQRMEQKGLKFSAIELGNEQYLPKFADSKIEGYEEVTKRTANMTPEKYVEACKTYIKQFKKCKLPFYVQFAPKSERNEKKYKTWNKTIISAINHEEFGYKKIYGSIHLYERNGANSLDIEQIKKIRNKIKKKCFFAVTEYGVVNKKKTLMEDDDISQEIELTKRILKEMKSGDIILNQVLYTNYKTIGSAVIHPLSNGLTAKGEEIMQLFKKYWKN